MIVFTLMSHHPNKDQDIFITALILYALLFTLIPGIYKYIVIAVLVVLDAGLYWWYSPKKAAAAVKKSRRLSRKGIGHKSRHSKSIRRDSYDPWYSDNVSIGSGSNYAYLDRQFYDTQFGGGAGSMTGGATWMYQDRMFNGRGLGECTRWSYDKAFQRQPPANNLSPSTVRLPPDARDPLMIDNRDRVHELDPYNDAASIVYDMSSCHDDTVSTMSVDPDA